MALWRVFVVPEEPAVPWRRVLGLIDCLRASPALEEGVYPNTGHVTCSVFPAASLLFRVPQQCPSQLENGERLQLTGRAGREAVGTPWSRARPSASRVLGHPGGLGWAAGSALQGWTRPSARVPGRMLWSQHQARGVSWCLTGMEVSLPASPSAIHESGSCWSHQALATLSAFAGGRGLQLGVLVWELHPEQPRVIPALRGARAAAWGRKRSLGGGLGSDLGWAGGEKERQSPGGSPVPPSPPPHGIYPAGAWLCCEQSHLPS